MGLLLFTGPALGGQNVASAVLQFVPVPDWVERHDFDHAPPDPEMDGAPKAGVALRLLEAQINFSGGREERYQRRVYALYSKAGIAAASILYGAYSSGSQTLRVSAFRIWRDGEPIDIADQAMVQVVNSGSNLETQLAADAAVIIIYVPDLRVGDLLEFATLVSGETPGLEDQRTDIFKDSTQVQIDDLYRLVFTDPAHPVHFHSVGGAVPPQRREAGDRIEYVYHATDLKPVESRPSQVPPWYYAEPMTIVTGAADWGDVVDWARPRFAAAGPASEAVAEQARALSAGATSARERLERIAAFVQGRIKYLGPGLSRNGYRPFAPEDVLKRRWGDCKDKVGLLIAMLDAVGIHAVPALAEISTGYVDPDIPTPLAFDHLIAAVEIEGATLWIDATGTPRDARRPSFELAKTNLVLPVRTGQRELVPLPVPHTVGPDGFDIDMIADIDLLSGRKGTFTVRYAGLAADQIRAILDSSGSSAITQTYLGRFKSLGDYVEAADDLIVNDSYAENRIVLAQDFKARYFWVWDKGKERYSFEIWPIWLKDFAPSLSEDETAREVPFAMPFPQDVRESYHLRIPEGLDLSPPQDRIEREAYLLAFDSVHEGSDLTLTMIFRTFRDHLKPDEVATYLEDRKRFANWSYTLWASKTRQVPEGLQQLFDKLSGGTEVRSANIPKAVVPPATDSKTEPDASDPGHR